MATYDAIGLPFPKSEPLFSEDSVLQKMLRQAEDLIEIYNELGAIVQQVDGLLTLQSHRVDLLKIGIYGLHVEEAISSGCIVAYGKSFSTSSRVKLDADAIYRSSDLLAAHDFYIALRNKLYAHQEYVGNQHQLFVFQSMGGHGPKLNPFGQHHSVVVSSGLDWDTFRTCVELCRAHTKQRVESVCVAIESGLSDEQVAFIDSCDRASAMEKYWQLSPGNRRDPLDPR